MRYTALALSFAFGVTAGALLYGQVVVPPVAQAQPPGGWRCTVPKSYGAFKTAVTGPDAVFEASDGTLRWVSVAHDCRVEVVLTR